MCAVHHLDEYPAGISGGQNRERLISHLAVLPPPPPRSITNPRALAPLSLTDCQSNRLDPRTLLGGAELITGSYKSGNNDEGRFPSPSWKPSQTVHCTICFSPVAWPTQAFSSGNRINFQSVAPPSSLSALLAVARSLGDAYQATRDLQYIFRTSRVFPYRRPFIKRESVCMIHMAVQCWFRCCYVHRARGMRNGVISCLDCAKQRQSHVW